MRLARLLVKEQRREIQSLAKKDQYWRPKIEGVGMKEKSEKGT